MALNMPLESRSLHCAHTVNLIDAIIASLFFSFSERDLKREREREASKLMGPMK